MNRVNPLVCSLAVLAAANVMNNRVAKRWAPVTSVVASGTLLMIARRAGLSWPELGFDRPRRGAAIGGPLAAGVAAVYLAGIALPRTRPLFHDERALALSRGRLLEEALVQVPLGSVLLDEVAFRSVLPALLGKSFSTPAAVAASAGLFGLWHVLPAMDMARANPALSRLASGEVVDDLLEDVLEDVRDGSAGQVAGDPGLRADVGAARGAHPVDVARLIAGTAVSTGIAGVLFHELRRRGGLLAPSLVHVATNSFGYVAARMARRLSERRGEGARVPSAAGAECRWAAIP